MMKHFRTLFWLLTLTLLTFGNSALAQSGVQWRGSGGWGPGGHYSALFNPQTVQSLTGEVVKIEKITPMKGMHSGIHLVVRTEKESLAVHLGPDWFIENQDVKLEPNDRVTVKGSRVTYEGKPALIASEVHRGDEVLKLREEDGRPMWAGWRRQR